MRVPVGEYSVKKVKGRIPAVLPACFVHTGYER